MCDMAASCRTRLVCAEFLLASFISLRIGWIMNHMPRSAVSNAAGAAQQISLPEEVVRSQRAVHRACAELRRGTPVMLTGEQTLVLLPAETAGAAGLAVMAGLSQAAPVLVLAPSRAAALFGEDETGVQAVVLSTSLLQPQALRSMADPTTAQLLPEPPVRVVAPMGSDAALALAKLARLLPAVVVAIVAHDAEAAVPALDLLCVSADDIRGYPQAAGTHLVRVAEAAVPLEHAADARVVAFRAPDAGIEHLAIIVGRPEAADAPLVRVHSECFTGDLLGSLRCDCGPQLREALRRMAKDGGGVLLYLAQEGRGIGLVNKLRAYAMQDRGLDTLDANRALGWGADERNFLIAATMLEQLGISRVRLLTNNPGKIEALIACGIDVTERTPHQIAPNGVNDGYLSTKATRFGHLL